MDENPHLYLLESEYCGMWEEEVSFSEVNPPAPKIFRQPFHSGYPEKRSYARHL